MTNDIIIEIYKQNKYTSQVAKLQLDNCGYTEFKHKMGYIVQDLMNREPRLMKFNRNEIDLEYITYTFYKRGSI